jgi:hypothetical protein
MCAAISTKIFPLNFDVTTSRAMSDATIGVLHQNLDIQICRVNRAALDTGKLNYGNGEEMSQRFHWSDISLRLRFSQAN